MAGSLARRFVDTLSPMVAPTIEPLTERQRDCLVEPVEASTSTWCQRGRPNHSQRKGTKVVELLSVAKAARRVPLFAVVASRVAVAKTTINSIAVGR